MSETLQGYLDASGLRVAIVAARFNEAICETLVQGATDCLVRHGIDEDSLTIARVPGCYEIPLIAKKLAGTGTYDAIIAVGVIIRGQTPHFDYLCGEVIKGTAQAGLESEVPVTFGVIMADSADQARDRSGGKAGNKGWEAAMAAIEMASLVKQIVE